MPFELTISYEEATRIEEECNQAWNTFFSKKRKKKPGFVYLAYSETGHYKIGRSVNPPERIKIFDTQMPVSVELVHTFETDDVVAAEFIAHCWFMFERYKGEWFILDGWDVKFMESIAGYFDNDFYYFEEGGS